MKILGLNPLDAGIVLLYLVIILWLGKRAQRRKIGRAHV